MWTATGVNEFRHSMKNTKLMVLAKQQTKANKKSKKKAIKIKVQNIKSTVQKKSPCRKNKKAKINMKTQGGPKNKRLTGNKGGRDTGLNTSATRRTTRHG